MRISEHSEINEGVQRLFDGNFHRKVGDILTIGILVPSLSLRFGILISWFAMVARSRLLGIELCDDGPLHGSVDVKSFNLRLALAVLIYLSRGFKAIKSLGSSWKELAAKRDDYITSIATYRPLTVVWPIQLPQ